MASMSPLRRASSAVFSSLPFVNKSAGQKMIRPTPIATLSLVAFYLHASRLRRGDGNALSLVGQLLTVIALVSDR